MLLTLVPPKRLRRILERMFDTEEFLSPYGIRSLSAATRQAVTATARRRDRLDRVRARRVAHRHVRRQLQLARPGVVPRQRAARRQAAHLRPLLRRRLHASRCPTGSGNWRTLDEAADVIDGGLTALFRPVDGRRPSDGKRIESSPDPLWVGAPDLLGVLRRRHRRGARRDAPDRVDRPRRPPAQPAAAPRPAHHGLGLSDTAYALGLLGVPGASPSGVCRPAGEACRVTRSRSGSVSQRERAHLRS